MSLKRALPPLVWLMTMGFVMAWLSTRLEVAHDLSVFLPSGSSPEEQLLLEELRAGHAAQLILLSISGGDDSQRANASKQLTTALRGSSLIAEVANGDQQTGLGWDDGLLAYRFLLSPQVVPTLFEQEQLHQALQRRLAELSSGLPLLDKRWLAHDPVGLIPPLLQGWQGAFNPAQRHGVWSDPAGQQALLMVHSTAAGFDLDQQQAVIDAIQKAFEGLQGAADLTLRMSGPAVFAVKSRETISTEVRRLSLWTSIAVALILLLAYRSWKVALVSVVPFATALMVGIVVTALLTGPIHGIALAFGMVLLGLTVDYPLHLFSQHRKGSTLAESARSIATPMAISALTTAMAFAVLALSDFPGLVQLGVMTASGLLAAAITTLWVLPVLTGTFPDRRLVRPEKLAHALASPHRTAARLWLLAGAAALALWYSLTISAPWDDDLGALSPIPVADRLQDQALRQALGAPDVRHLLLVRGKDLEQTLQQSEILMPVLDDLVREGVIQGFDLAARYLPSQTTQEARRKALPLPDELDARLARAGEGLPFRAGLFAPFVADIERARELPLLRKEDLTGTPLGMRVDSLLRQDADAWTALVVLRGVDSPARLAETLESVRPAFVRVLDLKQDTEAMVARFRAETLANSLMVGVAILLALLLWLRSPAALIRAIIPVLAAMALTVAALLALGEALTLFHLISLLLVLGIAIDYVVFLQSHGGSASSLAHTLHALLACVASTTVVFALLAGSPIPVLHAIGLTVNLGVPLALGAALLMGPRGGH
ncbi:MAG: MMPL family transporter [Pseudomonadota bacterium]